MLKNQIKDNYEYTLRTLNLTKQFKHQMAVDNVNINLKKGEIYGFLGQNGAGKTTTIRMLTGLIKATSGKVELFGRQFKRDDYDIYRHIGLLPDMPALYPNLTAEENLEIHRRMMDISEKNCIRNALETVGLTDTGKKTVKQYSLGMKKRLGLARALMHRPELLILDEPTNGLDPVGIKEIRRLILDLSQKSNISVFISSHILSELQQLVNKIGIIHKGKLLEEIDFSTFQKKSSHYIEVQVSDDIKSIALLKEKLGITECKISEPGVIWIYEKLNDSISINRILVENNIEVKSINSKNSTLEDYFIELIGGASNA